MPNIHNFGQIEKTSQYDTGLTNINSRAPIFDSTIQAVTRLSAQIRQPYGTRVVNLSAASVRT
jgi:hypothetical protein